jgi:DNA-binding transcriptional MerR regulator
MFGIKPRHLRYWLETGLIVPDYEADGRGDRHRFTTSNLVELMIVRSLVLSGVKPEEIRLIINELNEIRYFDRIRSPDPKMPVALVVRDQGNVEVRYGVRPEELLDGHQTVTYINLPRIEQCVREAILGGA